MMLRLDGVVLADLAFTSRSISRNCSRRDRLEVGEVEAQALRPDQGAALLHVIAQHLRSAACSRCVEEWCSAVARRAASPSTRA
jgi:hypothetical protein